MIKIRINKKGKLGDNIVSFYPVFLLFLIAGAAIAMSLMFFGKGYDGRQMEAGILADKIAQCIEEKGFEKEGFYERCGLNENVLMGRFVLKISGGESAEVLISFNNPTLCEIKAALQDSDYPRCSSEKISFNGVEYEIIAGSAERARREFA